MLCLGIKFFEVTFMKHRQIINLLFLALPVCVLLRIIQIKFTIDSATGFIKQPYSDISTLISFVIFAAIVCMFVLAYFTQNISISASLSQPVVSVSCILTAGIYFYEAISGILEISDIYSILLIFLSILASIVFLAYGINKMYPFNFPSIVLVVPIIYYVVKLIKLFVSTSALSLVTENIFLLFTNSAMLCFMFEFASYENHFGDQKKRPRTMFAYGIATTMFCVVTALPKLIFPTAYNGEISRADISSCLLMLSQAIFILSYIFCNFCPKESRTKSHEAKHC